MPNFQICNSFSKKILLFLLSEVKLKQKFLYRECLIISLEITLFSKWRSPPRESLRVSVVRAPKQYQEGHGLESVLSGTFFLSYTRNKRAFHMHYQTNLFTQPQANRASNQLLHASFFPFIQFTGSEEAAMAKLPFLSIYRLLLITQYKLFDISDRVSGVEFGLMRV